MKKSIIVSLIILSFLCFENTSSSMFGFFGNANELPLDSEAIQSLSTNSNFMESAEFNSIYEKLPKTGTTTRDFAAFTASPKAQKIFQPHFERIKLINCLSFQKNQASGRLSHTPKLSVTELYSGAAALKLAQSGKKVVVLIFADSTNVGGIYITKRGNPAGTQEEQTVLMAPEIYGYLGNNFGVHDIGGNGDEIYSAKQKRYYLNKNDYKNSNAINPAYGFILTNLLITHDVKNCSEIIKLPKEKIAEISYAFLSMPSFATDVSRDPTGAMLINCRDEKNGEKIYSEMNRAFSILLSDEKVGRNVFNNEVMKNIGKIAIFCPTKKLQDFADQYLGKNPNTSKIIAEITKLKLKRSEKVSSVFAEAQKNYEKCVLDKFTNLIRGTEAAGADTLVLGKIGCGAFLNDENEIASLLGRALIECRSIKHIYFAGLSKTDSFVKKVKTAMEKAVKK